MTQLRTRKARPFLKWAGGKRQLISQIDRFLPPALKNGRLNRYVEPFVGSGAVFFHIVQNYPVKDLFIADINPRLPVCFLAFRPNYALEHHTGATAELMDRCVAIARKHGLRYAYWSGHTDIPGSALPPSNKAVSAYQQDGARAAGAYAHAAGCITHPRNCIACTTHQTCAVKRYVPQINT